MSSDNTNKNDDFVVVNEINMEPWETWYENSWRTNTVPLTFTDSKARIVACWLNVEVSKESSKIIHDIRKEMHDKLKCTECRIRSKKFAFWRGENFAPVAKGFGNDRDQAFNVPVTKVTGITIITEPIQFPETVGENASDGGGWEHWTMWSPTVSHKDIDAETLETTVHTYIPLITAMFEKHSAPGIKDSLRITADLLTTEVTYGKSLVAATEWAHKHMIEDFSHKSPSQQIEIVLAAIMDAPHMGGSNPILHYHKFNNTITMLMEKAHCKESFISMANTLLSPENYQRRTGEASAGNIRESLKILGDFATTHMSLERAYELPGAIIVNHTLDKTKSTSEVMKAMLTSKSKPKSGAAGFADKVGKISKFSNNTTLKDLLSMESIDDLEIYCGSSHWVGLYDHDLGDKICYPWMWCFHTRGPSHVGLHGWVKVDSLVPGNGESNGKFSEQVYFLCRGAKLPDASTGFINNCLIEEFLVPEHRRTCGKAFAQLQNSVQAIVPAGKPLAIGIGACVSKLGTSSLNAHIRLRVNKTEFTITKHH